MMSDLAASRSLILDIAQSATFDVAELVAAIEELEQQHRAQVINHDLTELAGQWQLIWTSGTSGYQQLKARIDRRKSTANQHQSEQDSPTKPGKVSQNVLQSFDPQAMQITNQVRSQFGEICVSGSFIYSSQNRVKFDFNQVSFRLANLPALAIPLTWLGNTQGWLQTTYLDQDIHIERGDRGGISVFVKVR
jgi:hypothetical protein